MSLQLFGHPFSSYTMKALIALDAWPARACIKVDDAPVGIEEGKAAGCWTVGLSASGNGVSRSAASAIQCRVLTGSPSEISRARPACPWTSP